VCGSLGQLDNIIIITILSNLTFDFLGCWDTQPVAALRPVHDAQVLLPFGTLYLTRAQSLDSPKHRPAVPIGFVMLARAPALIHDGACRCSGSPLAADQTKALYLVGLAHCLAIKDSAPSDFIIAVNSTANYLKFSAPR
jgi:hypothetical protein